MQSNELVELMNQVNSNLSNFIMLQNQAMGGGGLLSIFKKIDFGAIYAKLSDNTDVLSSVRNKVDGVKGEPVELFREYLTRLINTQMLFSIVVVKLYQKSEGEPYPPTEYKADLAKFKEAEKGYLAMGEQMNGIYKTALASA